VRRERGAAHRTIVRDGPSALLQDEGRPIPLTIATISVYRKELSAAGQAPSLLFSR
jgi:hypothetical protein